MFNLSISSIFSNSEFAKENVTALKSKGVEIEFNFDATDSSQNEEMHQEFDLIIFMFPHIGGKMKIHKNRELIKQFGISAAKMLKNSDSKVIITLYEGQGGTPFDKIQRKEADSWQIIKMMSYSHLG